MRNNLQETYGLEDAVVDCIEFVHSTKVGSNDNTKSVSIREEDDIFEGKTITDNDDSTIPPRPLTLADCQMKVRHQRGDTIEVDCSCDSAYMLTAMDRVGAFIRDAYSWIPRSEECYLVMDNAGGHGTREAIEEYVRLLKEKWNVETIFQVP